MIEDILRPIFQKPFYLVYIGSPRSQRTDDIAAALPTVDVIRHFRLIESFEFSQLGLGVIRFENRVDQIAHSIGHGESEGLIIPQSSQYESRPGRIGPAGSMRLERMS